MNLPPDSFLNATLRVGTIYHIVDPGLGVDGDHFFIVVLHDDEENYLVVCTSQREKQEEFFERTRLDLASLVCIPPDDQNGLSKDTFVNCHEAFPFPKEVLLRKYTAGELSYIGYISYDQFDQIRTGIRVSRTNDLPDEFLIHPEDD